MLKLEKTYGELNVNLGTNKNRKITIGNYCSIGPNVHFIINPHNYHFFRLGDGKYMNLMRETMIGKLK